MDTASDNVSTKAAGAAVLSQPHDGRGRMRGNSAHDLGANRRQGGAACYWERAPGLMSSAPGCSPASGAAAGADPEDVDHDDPLHRRRAHAPVNGNHR